MNIPLSFSPKVATSSIEETERLFKGEFAKSRILNANDSDSFGVAINSISIGSAKLSFIAHNTGYEVDCGAIDSPDYVMLGFGCGQPSSTSLDGQHHAIANEAVVITRHNKVSHKRNAGSCEMVLKLKLDSVEARLQQCLDRSVSSKLAFASSVALGSGIGAHAKSTIAYIMNSLDSNPELLELPLIAANFQDTLESLILSLPNNYSIEISQATTRPAAPAVVSRAEEYIEASADLPITISDVLRQVGCCRKTLFSNFQKYRGYTPGKFLINTRLSLAHNRLSRASRSDSVTSIALDSGFSHLGRFSEAYVKRYAIRPSETLKRSCAR